MQVRDMSIEERKLLHGIIWMGKDFTEFRRALVILFSSLGMTIPKIAEKVRFDEQVVHDVINHFNDVGLECIKDGSDGLLPAQFGRMNRTMHNWINLNNS